MALKYFCTIFLILLILSCVFSKVYWKLSSLPAIFGQDIVLTCHLEEIFTNPKDCAVRQWSGGPERRGLVYNGFSSDINKYEEHANIRSFEFSLIIKHLTESDIDVNYTCSCGFNTSTKNLSLNANSFYYPPIGINHTFSIKHDLLGVSLIFNKVYPVPNCSLHIGGSLIMPKVQVQYESNGLVYSVRYNAFYTLTETDCNKFPELKCKFNHDAEELIFKGRETYHCLVDKSKPEQLKKSTRSDAFKSNSSSNKISALTTTIVIAVISTVVCVIAITVVVCILKHKGCCQGKGKRNGSMKTVTNVSCETDCFVNDKTE